MYTWFMTKSNYGEMRSSDLTDVFVPLFNKTWELPLYAAFNTMRAFDVPSCWVKKNPHNSESGWEKLQHKKVIHKTYKFKYDILATVKNSGEYKVKCVGMNWDDPRQKALKVETTKSLRIKFIQGNYCNINGKLRTKVARIQYSFSNYIHETNCRL